MPRSKKETSLFAFDEKIRHQYMLVAGIDEAGRGPLAGPVVAAAVILPGGLIINGLRDSKKLNKNELRRIFWEIVNCCCVIGIGTVDADLIDKSNILKSTKLAMSSAVSDLQSVPDMLLIDAVKLPELKIPQKSIIRGESVSASIAAASVVAKTVRDDIMHAYHRQYPKYNFCNHKGYSTKEHIERLRIHGPCPIHRKTFRKVYDLKLPLDKG